MVLPALASEGARTLIPLGNPVGIKLFAEGALVISISGDPAEDSDLRVGDLLLRINDTEITSAEQLQEFLSQNGSRAVTLTYRRSGRTCQCTLTPQCSEDGRYRLGAWVRDSMAGIGTMTYYDPATGQYGALGHGILDVDTQSLMSLASGSIMETSVKAIRRGTRGDPGELKGDFSVQRDVGTLCANTTAGVFGQMQDTEMVSGTPVPVALPSQVHTGRATILSTVAGSEPQCFDVEILRLYDNSATRNLLLRITDAELLQATGGIVQGMSGSPILQDGQLVGAVTHVMVNDPTQGYGIFIENMLHMAG